jgi:hypothetical protein
MRGFDTRRATPAAQMIRYDRNACNAMRTPFVNAKLL